jgi:TatA/E family protein of Tat protein translocase
MFGIGATELGVILVVALLVFGPKRLPELARMFGRGIGEFRRASNELRQSLALDDLQNDLRRELTGRSPVQRPAPPPSRPAQAGDDLEPGGAPPRTSSETPGAASGSEPAAQSRETQDVPSRHPGELPPGDDHAHHDLPSDEEEPSHDDTSDRPRPAARAGSDLGNVPVTGEEPVDRERG